MSGRHLQRRISRSRVVILTSAVLAFVVAMSAVASAFWAGGAGSGTGTATTGTLGAPTSVSATADSLNGAVAVSWNAPVGLTPTGYYVLRQPSSGPAVAACGTSAAAPTTGTSCSDTSVPLGTYTYVVVGIYRTWTSTSAPSAAVTVEETHQAITFTSSPVNPQVGGTYTVTATGGGSGNPVVFSAGSPSVCSVSGSTVTFLHAGTCVINANQAGNSHYTAAPQVQQTFTVDKAAQVITFTSSAPSNATVGGTGYTPVATGGASGNAVTLSIDASTASNCSIASGVVTYQHVGSCTVNANQAGSSDYLAAPQVQQSYAIGKGAQAITFTSTAPANAKVGDFYTVSATATSGLSVSFGSGSSSICTVSGSTVSMIAAGTCVVTANQAGNTDYLAASQVQQSFAVTKKDQTVTFNSTVPNAAVYQGASYTVSATATSGLTVAFSSATPGVCTVSGSTVSLVGVGTCTINGDQAGNGTWNAAVQAQQSFTVAKASQTINFAALADKTFGNGTFTVSATASSGLTVSFSSTTTAVCTVNGNTVTIVGAGSCTIAADQAGNANYTAAPRVTQSFTVAKANQTISFTAPTTPVSANSSASLTFSSNSGLAVTVTPSSTTVCSVTGSTVNYLTSGTCTLTATQVGDGNYNAATPVVRTVTVNKAAQTISFAQPTTPANAGTSAPLVASSTSGLVVTFTTTSAATICTVSGTTVSYVGSGNCVINANQSGDATFAAAAQVQRTVVIVQPFAITGKTDTSPQNTTRIQGTGPAGGSVTVYICAGTVATCGPGSPSLDSTSPQTATILANGTWNSSAFSKLGNGTFTAQAVLSSPATTSNAFTFTN